MVPSPAGDITFDSTNTSPVSPQGFNNYFFCAPTSPSHSFYRQISLSFTPIISQHSSYDYDYDYEEEVDASEAFAFKSGGDLDLPPLSSADELFEGGKIKPCQPTITRKKILKNALSFCQNNEVSREHFQEPTHSKQKSEELLSFSRSSFGWLHKKWSLKDLLFRSASEGHETSKKYDFLRKFRNEDSKINSGSNITGPGSVSSEKKKKKKVRVAALSAHERHYKVNRAATEVMRKRTYLPYKQSLIMGCMDPNAAAVRDPSLRHHL